MSVKDVVDKIKSKRDELESLEKKFRLVVERSVQQTSGGTFFVCLPKEWAEKVGLEKGSKLTVAWLPDDTLSVIA